jgi:hypothetical protein
VAKFVRIGRLYKLIRMVRLAKLFKLLKSKNTLFSQFNNRLKTDQGQERLLFTAFFLLFFLHMASCFFIIIAQLIDGDSTGNHDVPKTWLDLKDYDSSGNKYNDTQTYVLALYFTVTTVATVGYGDVTPVNSVERIYCVMLMLTGVLLVTYVSGALASILTQADVQQAAHQEKLLYLNKLRL